MAGAAALGEQRTGMVGILEVAVAVVATRMPSDELVVGSAKGSNLAI
jgi:hypothetical protein